jgi:hypothetical protein
MRRSWLFAICAAGLLAPSSAHAGGGPVAPVLGGTGVSTSDGTENYVALAAGRGTMVERVRQSDGAIVRARLVPGRYGVPGAAYDGTTTGLSADGSTLVLAERIGSRPLTSTRLVVLDARSLGERKRFRLPEFISVDAISPDGRTLYVLRYPKTRATYDVMALDLRTGKFRGGPIMDPREPDEQMSGFPLRRVMSPDGRWAYTLYSGEENFVHALDTLQGEARCIDLPQAVDLSAQALELDGSTLRVGSVATIDLRTFEAAEPAATATATATPRAMATPAPAGPGGGGIPWVPVVLGIAVLAGVALLLSARRPEPLDVTLTHHVDKEKATR